MSPNIRKLLIAVLALALCVSVAMLVRQSFQYREGEAEYAEAQALAELPDLSDLEPVPAPEPSPAPEPQTEEPAEAPVYTDPYADALASMDFAALRVVNPDVLGWILIPGTVVSYPLLQGDDNDYYLDHTWKKWTNVVGSIFLECRNNPDLTDFNTVIYGHRMNNGSMFASLKNYRQQSYWAQHPTVYITDDNGVHSYEIFAAYEISTVGDTYRLHFSTDQDKQDYIDYCLEQSVIDTGLTPTVYDRIQTLSTCTGSGHATRWVVEALLRGQAPPAEPTQEETAPAPEDGPRTESTAGSLPADGAQPSSGTETPTGEGPRPEAGAG